MQGPGKWVTQVQFNALASEGMLAALTWRLIDLLEHSITAKGEWTTEIALAIAAGVGSIGWVARQFAEQNGNGHNPKADKESE